MIAEPEGLPLGSATESTTRTTTRDLPLDLVIAPLFFFNFILNRISSFYCYPQIPVLYFCC